MPNYCVNKMEVSGQARFLERMIRFIRVDGNALDFNKIVPCPYKPADIYDFPLGASIPDQNVNLDWYIKNWGTSSNAIDTSVSKLKEDEKTEAATLTISFFTAWSPSIPITVAISKKFPKLFFAHWYEEGSNNLSGKALCQSGELISKNEGCYGEFRLEQDEFYKDIDEPDQN
jgi:hypothetical protein